MIIGWLEKYSAAAAKAPKRPLGCVAEQIGKQMGTDPLERESIARILYKSLLLEVQLAILLEVASDEVERFAALLANQVSTQQLESLQRGVEWSATLKRVRKGDGDRRVQMLGYVLARVAAANRPAEK